MIGMAKQPPTYDELKRCIEAAHILEETKKLFGDQRTNSPEDDADDARLANAAVWTAEEGLRLARVDLLVASRAAGLPGIEIQPSPDLVSFSGDGLLKLARSRAQDAADRSGRRTRMVLPDGREVSASPKGG